MSEIIKLQISHGINRFKCSTIAEAEMTACSGASDVLLAMQPVGPNIDRFFSLITKFPNVKFSCLADNETTVNQLAEKAVKARVTAHIWIDINNSMNRTGITPDDKALRFYDMIIGRSIIKIEGLHVYDGHINDADFTVRKQKSDEAFKPVLKIAKEIQMPFKIIIGGSPTFGIHAQRENSPGTVLLCSFLPFCAVSINNIQTQIAHICKHHNNFVNMTLIVSFRCLERKLLIVLWSDVCMLVSHM